MSFVDVSIELQVEVSEDHPSLDSDIAPEERPNHPHMEAGDLEDMGIFVGEVYDERIIEDF
jgi:hypothetical protein